jgi:phosphatidate cytidylyltransferase
VAEGSALACPVGAVLYGFTPFNPLQAGLLSLALVVGGSIGGLAPPALKHCLNAKDRGVSLPVHGGVLDRRDSVAFSAPIFFQLARYWCAL